MNSKPTLVIEYIVFHSRDDGPMEGRALVTNPDGSQTEFRGGNTIVLGDYGISITLDDNAMMPTIDNLGTFDGRVIIAQHSCDDEVFTIPVYPNWVNHTTTHFFYRPIEEAVDPPKS